jgi:phage/plasmid-like protein (TIGR03299 family)
MSHEIETHGKQAAFVAAHKSAWHELGTTLDHSFTASEAIEEGYLGGWNVRKDSLVTAGGIAVPGKYAVVRNNPFTDVPEALGVVGEAYHIVQNEEHCGILDALVDESGAHFDTAGSLDGGRKVFVTMKLPGHISVGGVDPVEQHIAAINSHDGSMAFTLMVTPVRVVCANTLNAAFGNHSHLIRIRHTSGAQQGLIAAARNALELSFNYLDEFQESAERLINTTMTSSRFEEIITAEFGAPEDAAPATRTRAENKIDDMISLFCDADTHEGMRNTAWAGFNAMVEWWDHQAPVRGEGGSITRAERALLSSKFANRALELVS